MKSPNRTKIGLNENDDITHNWAKTNVETVLDYLHYYKTFGAFPLNKAFTKMTVFYRPHNINLFKESLNSVELPSSFGIGQAKARMFPLLVWKANFCIKVFHKMLSAVLLLHSAVRYKWRIL